MNFTLPSDTAFNSPLFQDQISDVTVNICVMNSSSYSFADTLVSSSALRINIRLVALFAEAVSLLLVTAVCSSS
jgi:hypothetical protein